VGDAGNAQAVDQSIARGLRRALIGEGERDEDEAPELLAGLSSAAFPGESEGHR
jgi:hypothetical protein